MLVDNKFIFLSIPRTATASFHLTCVRNNLNVKFANSDKDNQYYDLSLSNEDLIKSIEHGHERINDLYMMFGTNYDIIAIKRDRHERFLSFWKFFIKMSKTYGNDVYEIVKSFKIEDILSFDPLNLYSLSKINQSIDLFLKNHNLIDKVDNYFKNLLFILWEPTSAWHNNDSRIIWFDFNKLNEMEEWVSNKLNKPFKLEYCNSSEDVESNFIVDDNFTQNYNKIYDSFDFIKNKKSII
jgi:hypothetical protein